jgi:hypothetical protein
MPKLKFHSMKESVAIRAMYQDEDPLQHLKPIINTMVLLCEYCARMSVCMR